MNTISEEFPHWVVDPDDEDPTDVSDFLAWAIDNRWPPKGDDLELLEYDAWWMAKDEEAA